MTAQAFVPAGARQPGVTAAVQAQVSVGTDGARFYAGWTPTLAAGTYRITAGFDFKDGSGTIPSALPSATQEFIVSGPHYSLAATDLLSSFPPPNGGGDYGAFLPQAVLARPGLPWLRVPGSVDPTPPWLALLLLTPDEITAPAGALPSQNPTLAGTDTVANVVAPTLAGYLQPTVAVLEDNESPTALCRYVDLPLTSFQLLLPSNADLCVMAHARTVATSGDLADGAADGAPVAALIGNRLPRSGTANIVHLVSLEGFTDYLKDGPKAGAIPAGTTTVRLVSLLSWSFQSIAGRTFASRIDALDAGPLSLPHPTPSAPTAAETAVMQALDSGYVPLGETLREGERTVSWYRGPLVPVPLAEQARGSACYTASAASVYDPSTGMFDQSYAGAWQIGRLLALSSGSFVQRVLGLRQSLSQAVAGLQRWQSLTATLGAPLGLPSSPPATTGTLPAMAARYLTAGLGTAGGAALVGTAQDPQGLTTPPSSNRT